MICEQCDQEMINSVTCEPRYYELLDGSKVDALPVTQYLSHNGICHDCNAPIGGYHHPGCDAEICPICNGQLISCDCPYIGREEND